MANYAYQPILRILPLLALDNWGTHFINLIQLIHQACLAYRMKNSILFNLIVCRYFFKETAGKENNAI